MKRQHLIQLLQYLLVLVWIWLFVVFVMEESFIDFVLKYRVLFLIASVSYFYYYSIEYEVDKKYKFIRSALLCGNAYLFAHVFFRPLLGISHELFILLWLIILWLWWTTKMTNKRKWILQVLGWILSFCILISGIFYLYPEEPDVVWFMNTRDYQILAHWISEPVQKRDAYIRIIWNKKTEDFEIEPGFYKELVENCRILYSSLKNQRDEKILIKTPEWGFYQIFPQSELQIEFLDWNISKIAVLNWNVWFLSGLFDPSIELLWNGYVFSDEELQELKILQESYNEELVDYLKNQISGENVSLANNEMVYKIDGKIIRFLSRIFPTSYSNNLRNYNEFQKYFDLVENDEIELWEHSNWAIYSKSTPTTSLRKSLRKNIDTGKGSWYIF